MAAPSPPAGDETRFPAIVGGTVAAPGAWPWTVRLDWITTDGLFGPPTDGQEDDFFTCGGSLIGERWVLTAGHCMLDPFFGLVVGSPEFNAVYGLSGIRFRLVVGETKVDEELDQGNVYTVFPDDVIVLPATGTLGGDLALIRLDRPAPQRAIRVPGVGQDSSALSMPGGSATAIGWGSTSEDDPNASPDLRQVDVPFVSDADCQHAFQQLGVTIFDPHTMICAGVEGRDTCFGDSGGPLMAQTPTGEWVQIGITSWGEGCARAGLAGVYGRLPGLYGFILTQLRDDFEAPAGPPAVENPRAARVRAKSARILAEVDPNGLATLYVIEFGVNKRYLGGRFEGYAGAGDAATAISALLKGLKPKTAYHVRVTAMNLAGVTRSADLILKTR